VVVAALLLERARSRLSQSGEVGRVVRHRLPRSVRDDPAVFVTRLSAATPN
jgi:hypothetical protein